MSGTRHYERVVTSRESDSLYVLAQWIPSGSTVLDVGCASGALGAYLTRIGDCRIDGLDQNFTAVAGAHAYRRVVVADLDRSCLDEFFPQESYEFIVMADVLEHLRDPAKVLTRAQRLLQPGGHILISVPNAAYAPLLAELLHARLDYRDSGLLDQSHVRLFTRTSLLQLLASTGLQAARFERVVRSADESEFDGVYLEALPPAVTTFLESCPDAFTYQILVDCVPFGLSEPAAPPPPTLPSIRPLRFLSRLFWRTGSGAFDEHHSVTTVGRIGEDRQTIRFTLPNERIGGLVLEPCDRLAMIIIRRVAVTTPAGPIWTWSSSSDALDNAPRERIGIVRTGEGTRLVITGREPRLHLPIPDDTLLAASAPMVVEIEFDWPLPTESLLVVERLRDRFVELDHANDRIATLTAERSVLSELLTQRLELLQSSGRAWAEAVRERDLSLAFLDDHRQTLQVITERLQALTDRVLAIEREIGDDGPISEDMHP